MNRISPPGFRRIRIWAELGYKKRTPCTTSPSFRQHTFTHHSRTMATTPRPSSIAIIGAGPAGLTLASLLTLRSIPYTLFERSASPPGASDTSRAGGSLDIHPETGQLALREAGLFDEFASVARYEDTVFSIFDKTGKRVLQMGQGRDAPEIDRGELTRILLGGVPPETIRWGCGLEKVERAEDGTVELTFGNGEVRGGWRLVVGADGARSRVRGLVCFFSFVLACSQDGVGCMADVCRSQALCQCTRDGATSRRGSAAMIPTGRRLLRRRAQE